MRVIILPRPAENCHRPARLSSTRYHPIPQADVGCPAFSCAPATCRAPCPIFPQLRQIRQCGIPQASVPARYVPSACFPCADFQNVNLRMRPLRESRVLLMMIDRLCRYSLLPAFCAQNAALAPPAVKDSFNTILEQSLSKIRIAG